MATQRDKQFKLDAVQYYLDHKDLGVRGCAENLGVGYSTLTRWLKNFREAGADWPNSVHQKSADCKPEFQPAISTGRLNFSLQSSQIHALNFLLLYGTCRPTSWTNHIFHCHAFFPCLSVPYSYFAFSQNTLVMLQIIFHLV